MSKIYNIWLDGNQIGSTRLEKADAPMGVVFGEIVFNNISSGYDFFKSYCLRNKIGFTDIPENRLILTVDIANLRVTDIEGVEIKGLAYTVSGMDKDIFEITIEGIGYPFYAEEFPQHAKQYNDKK